MEHWSCEWDAPRPFVHPLRTPAGALVSIDAPPDHPWHHGLWFAIKLLNGENFWEEYDEFGTLRTRRVEPRPGGGVRAEIDWVRPDGETLAARELRSITPVQIDADAYALDWEVTLTTTVDTLLDRTPFTTWGGYGGLTLRGALDWVDTALLLPDGAPLERLLGEPAPWCSLQGRAPRPDGSHAIAGVALLDHPDNARFPTPWYGSTRADTYGEGWANFLNAAFLWEEGLRCAAGVPMTRRHRVIVHDGDWSTERLADAHRSWLDR